MQKVPNVLVYHILKAFVMLQCSHLLLTLLKNDGELIYIKQRSTTIPVCIKPGSDAAWSSCYQKRHSPDSSPAKQCHIPTSSLVGHRPVCPGPGYHQSKGGDGGTPPASHTTAPQKLQLTRTCWEIMLKCGYEGGSASGDSGRSCNPPAAVQTLTA